MSGRLKIFMIFLILLSATVVALEPDERTYFDQQNQKIVAQLTQKIDSQTNQVERDMKSAVNNAKDEIKAEMSAEIKSNLNSVAIGLAGLIIVTLAVFKVIDLRLSSTRNIRKYESQLQDKQKEYDKMMLDLKSETKKVIDYKNSLVQFQNQLVAFSKGLAPQPSLYGIPEPPKIELNIPKPPKTKRRFLFFKRKN